MDESLVPLLSALLGQAGQRSSPLPPITVNVNLSPTDELVELRQQVAALEAQLACKDTELNRAEYLFRCESIINTRITDYCRENGIKLPKHLLKQI